MNIIMRKRTIRLRLRPTPSQEQFFWQSAGARRWAYNYALDKMREHYEKTGETLSAYDISKILTEERETDPKLEWTKYVSRSTLTEAITAAYNAKIKHIKYLKALKSGKPAGRKVGEPKKKRRKDIKQSFCIQTSEFKLGQMPRTIHVPKLRGKHRNVYTSGQLPKGVKYGNPTISYDGKYWFITVAIDKECVLPELTDEVIGVDLGIEKTVALSDGQQWANINRLRIIKQEERKLKRQQRKFARQYEKNKEVIKETGRNTKNMMKTQKTIRHINRRITNLRDNYIHQMTNAIVRTNPKAIVIEDLNIQGMMRNRHLAKSIQNQKWYEIARQITYKAEERGTMVIVADRYYPSSKLCSQCGNKYKQLTLKDRTYNCRKCGYEADRDLNAALNLKKYGMNKIGMVSPESTPPECRTNAYSEHVSNDGLAKAGMNLKRKGKEQLRNVPSANNNNVRTI